MWMFMKTIHRVGMRIAMIALCSGALMAIPVMAQDAAPAGPPAGGPGGRMQGRQLEMMTQKLNLTTDQQTQIKAIQSDTMKQMMALREDTSLSQADKQSKMMDLRTTSQSKIRAVLTDEQKPKFDEMQAQMRERMKERQQGGPPPQ
jgi:Spy/CpxP family protein refolding chaperone